MKRDTDFCDCKKLINVVTSIETFEQWQTAANYYNLWLKKYNPIDGRWMPNQKAYLAWIDGNALGKLTGMLKVLKKTNMVQLNLN